MQHILMKGVYSVLTPKQEKFVQGIVDGKTQTDAYKNAYNTAKMSDSSIYQEASRLMNNPQITARIEELRQRIDERLIMSAKKRAEKLTEFIKDADPLTAMKAIDILNKMTGEYVQKVQADVSQEIEVNITLED